MASTTPPWLREEHEVAQPLKNVSSHGETAHRPISNEKKSRVIYWILKIITMCLCVLIIITAIIGIQCINGVESSGKIFVATYMFFFSLLLFLFELSEIRPIEWLDHLLRRNFGFLYGTMGKSLYIIFIAFLSFGLGDPEYLTMSAGISTALFGALEFTLYLKYPELFDETEGGAH
eukprot:CAMPEP_0170369832 /NCGR_PEP_ID=MMETSP0117_2-20130122/8193_1 /TAXON_ID=400756 /ORGANISM="Durinskia baltica, Strain CSIRO CS-38" /LENGTH=175 /DNA_ID=CAMNT_0010624577 /DNA_START=71 /DNA_END=598 /DNA_ORIENTATION=+